MRSIRRAAKEALKFTIWMALILVLTFGVGLGILLGVDYLPVIEPVKIGITCLLWCLQFGFIMVFVSEIP